MKRSGRLRLQLAAVAALVLLASAAMSSCQRASDARTPIAEICAKLGQRCRHSSGQVGYCALDKTDGLQCMSQH